MKVPELGLLQSSNAGSQLSKAPPIAKGAVVAASGLLTVMLGLIQLPELFPQPRLHRVPEQRLYTAVQGFQLPMEGPWGRRPWSIIWFVGVPRATAM